MFAQYKQVRIKTRVLTLACCLSLLSSGCFVPRVQVGPSILKPVSSFKKEVKAPQDPQETQAGFGFDLLMGLYVPLTTAKDLFQSIKVERKKGGPFGVGLSMRPGLWMSVDLGYSLDSDAFPGKFVAGFGLSLRLSSLLAIGYTPYLLLAGSELGTHIGMRHSLTLYLFNSILMIEPQYEFAFSGNRVTHGFRVMLGINLLTPFILLAKANLGI